MWPPPLHFVVQVRAGSPPSVVLSGVRESTQPNGAARTIAARHMASRIPFATDVAPIANARPVRGSVKSAKAGDWSPSSTLPSHAISASVSAQSRARVSRKPYRFETNSCVAGGVVVTWRVGPGCEAALVLGELH